MLRWKEEAEEIALGIRERVDAVKVKTSVCIWLELRIDLFSLVCGLARGG